MSELPYLAGYSEELQERAAELLQSGQLADRLAERYPDRHRVLSNKDLASYVQELKARYLRTAPPLSRVLYDPKLHVIHNALGLHTTKARAHGARIHTRREVRIAGLLREGPPEFLRAIVVHELAHMKHAEHDRAFYRLCLHMEPEYHQLELDLRLHLTVRELDGQL